MLLLESISVVVDMLLVMKMHGVVAVGMLMLLLLLEVGGVGAVVAAGQRSPVQGGELGVGGRSGPVQVLGA
jgi:hypothetical protein